MLATAVPSYAGIGSDIRKESVLEAAYDRTPLAAVAQLNVLMHRTVQMLPAVTARFWASDLTGLIPASILAAVVASIS